MSMKASGRKQSGSIDANQHDENLTKQIKKMIARIEKILYPSSSLEVNVIGRDLESLIQNLHRGDYYCDANIGVQHSQSGRKIRASKLPTLESTFSDRIVDWKSLEKDIIDIISRFNPDYIVPTQVQEEINTEKKLQDDFLFKLRSKEKLTSLKVRASFRTS